MNIDEVILELYRLAETKKWRGDVSDKALFAAIEGMELIKAQKIAERRKTIIKNANKKQPRVWC